MFGFFESRPVEAQTPISFGWKAGWFALRAEPEVILERLAKSSKPVSWEGAIERLKGSKPFLTPQYDGWSLLVTRADKIESDLATLAELLESDVAYFESHRGVGAAAYGWTERGKVVRVHSQSDYALHENVGELSAVERSLGILPLIFDQDDWSDDEVDANPHEESVIRLAGKLTVDPTTLDQRPPSVVHALKPRRWR